MKLMIPATPLAAVALAVLLAMPASAQYYKDGTTPAPRGGYKSDQGTRADSGATLRAISNLSATRRGLAALTGKSNPCSGMKGC